MSVCDYVYGDEVCVIISMCMMLCVCVFICVSCLAFHCTVELLMMC